jgi:hypothetical protein
LTKFERRIDSEAASAKRSFEAIEQLEQSSQNDLAENVKGASGSQFLDLHNGFFHCDTMTAVFVSGWFAVCFG